MATLEYAQLGEVGETPFKFVVVLAGYSDTASSDDTVQKGITGKLLVHRATQLKQWQGTIYLPASTPEGYGTLAQLRALYELQARLEWQSPTDVAATNVVWIGPFGPEYWRGPLDVAQVPFVLVEDGS